MRGSGVTRSRAWLWRDRCTQWVPNHRVGHPPIILRCLYWGPGIGACSSSSRVRTDTLTGGMPAGIPRQAGFEVWHVPCQVGIPHPPHQGDDLGPQAAAAGVVELRSRHAVHAGCLGGIMPLLPACLPAGTSGPADRTQYPGDISLSADGAPLCLQRAHMHNSTQMLLWAEQGTRGLVACMPIINHTP